MQRSLHSNGKYVLICGMNTKTEMLLYHLMWLGGMAMRPSYRNLDQSFDEWAYRNGFQKRIHALEYRRFVESKVDPRSNDRVWRVTEAGRLCAMGGRDPEACWSREWDGLWRMVIFDVPEKDRKLRDRLRRRLEKEHFGQLQRSVWISPDPFGELKRMFGRDPVFAGRIIFMEGTCCGGETAKEVAAAAWDFERIEKKYAAHAEHLKHTPAGRGAELKEQLVEWFVTEKELWDECMAVDPLLPACLNPSKYSGTSKWKKRVAGLNKAGRLARNVAGDGNLVELGLDSGSVVAND